MSLKITWTELLAFHTDIYSRESDSWSTFKDKPSPQGEDTSDELMYIPHDVETVSTMTLNDEAGHQQASDNACFDVSSLELDTETLDRRAASNSEEVMRDQAVLDFVSKQTAHRANFAHEIRRLGLRTSQPYEGKANATKVVTKLNY